MDDFQNEIADLIARSQTFKCQVIEAELQSCRLAMDLGFLEIRLGFFETAQHWMKEADKRSRAIPAVLPDIANEERRDEFKADLDELRVVLDAFWKASAA